MPLEAMTFSWDGDILTVSMPPSRSNEHIHLRGEAEVRMVVKLLQVSLSKKGWPQYPLLSEEELAWWKKPLEEKNADDPRSSI